MSMERIRELEAERDALRKQLKKLATWRGRFRMQFGTGEAKRALDAILSETPSDGEQEAQEGSLPSQSGRDGPMPDQPVPASPDSPSTGSTPDDANPPEEGGAT